MHIPSKLLNSLAVLLMALFFILLLQTIKPLDNIPPVTSPSTHPEYWQGIPLPKMGLDLIPLCDPIPVSKGPIETMIPAIAVSGGITGVPYLVHILWTEPAAASSEIVQATGPTDGSAFSYPRPVTTPNGYDSYNPVAINGAHYAYLGFLDEVMMVRDIWFAAGSIIGWTEPEPVSNLQAGTLAWGPVPIAFFDAKSGYELPLMLWYDHRHNNSEIFFASRVNGVNFLGPGKGGFALEGGGWHKPVRITDDAWPQYDLSADWASACADLERNIIHLVYSDSRFADTAPRANERKGNFEIFYRTIRPLGPLVKPHYGPNSPKIDQDWEVGEELRLSDTPDISDAPSVCAKKFQGNTDLTTAMVVWTEHDASWKRSKIYFRMVKDGTPGDIRLLTPPDAIAMFPSIIYIPMDGHSELAAVCYQQYEPGQVFPDGNANIYMRIIDGERISEPIEISNSTHTSGFPKLTRPGFNLKPESDILVTWGEMTQPTGNAGLQTGTTPAVAATFPSSESSCYPRIITYNPPSSPPSNRILFRSFHLMKH